MVEAKGAEFDLQYFSCILFHIKLQVFGGVCVCVFGKQWRKKLKDGVTFQETYSPSSNFSIH
jgi:hypothetical protein